MRVDSKKNFLESAPPLLYVRVWMTAPHVI